MFWGMCYAKNKLEKTSFFTTFWFSCASGLSPKDIETLPRKLMRCGVLGVGIGPRKHD
jgi:hypothetical protein